jgi:hypothetical protein
MPKRTGTVILLQWITTMNELIGPYLMRTTGYSLLSYVTKPIALCRLLVFTLIGMVVVTVAGCASFEYEYVLRVECEGRRTPGEIGEYVGLTPPVVVTITCDGKTRAVQFDPMGDTQIIRFGDSLRVPIDGDAMPRGFTVRIQRPGYKDWTATYDESRLMFTSNGGEQGGLLIRLDSIKLALKDSSQPSAQVSGGPERIETPNK